MAPQLRVIVSFILHVIKFYFMVMLSILQSLIFGLAPLDAAFIVTLIVTAVVAIPAVALVG